MRLFVFVIGLSILSIGCKPKVTYTGEVKTLDSLLTAVNQSEAEFNTIPSADIKSRLDSISKIVAYVKDNYGGEMSKEEGFLLDDYRATKSIVKKFGQRSSQIKVEIGRTTSQLTSFKEALEKGATHDKNGNIIDEPYVNKNMAMEKEAAENLISSISELKERSERFISENEKKLKDVLPYVNSLEN